MCPDYEHAKTPVRTHHLNQHMVNCLCKVLLSFKKKRGRSDRMVVGFTTTCAISVYHN